MINDISRHVLVGNEIIRYSRENILEGYDLDIRYRIDKENKEIRLYNVPRILSFEEKSAIYYALLDYYYFYPLNVVNKEYFNGNFSDYIVRENGYTYHEFNQISTEGFGILGELLFEIPRQKNETEKLSKIRDIYEMLQRSLNVIGKEPIYIAFKGIMPDFNDIDRVVRYVLEKDPLVKEKKEYVDIITKSGFLGTDKHIRIIPKKK